MADEKKTGTGNRGKAIMLTHPKTKQQVRRVDYIRECYGVGNKTRSEIRDDLNDNHGQSLVYQVVFQATKGMTQGTKYVEPPKPEKKEKDTKDASAGIGKSGNQPSAAA